MSVLDERSRIRAGLAFDIVLFGAPCPACGGEAEWLQQREDTRLRTTITCADPECRPPSDAVPSPRSGEG
ncbi:MAG: hypothetical protein JNL54_01100 [Kineosporiaceae bacterium]|nr:hypothetical protein [Kineosporiaceae bacterium]